MLSYCVAYRVCAFVGFVYILAARNVAYRVCAFVGFVYIYVLAARNEKL